jgi:hypothetical protein
MSEQQEYCMYCKGEAQSQAQKRQGRWHFGSFRGSLMVKCNYLFDAGRKSVLPAFYKITNLEDIGNFEILDFSYNFFFSTYC